MNRRTLVAALALATSLVPAAASAKVTEKGDIGVDATVIQEKQLVSGKQTLPPDKGYVFVHGPNALFFRLIKEPNEAERAAYDAQRKAAFETAKRKYPRQLRSWQGDRDIALKAHMKFDRPPPAEPTEANFSIGPIESRLLVGVGAGTYAKQKGDPGDYSALVALEPGTYRYYGTINPVPGRSTPVGMCTCMGSVSFTVEAGKIANLGDFLWLGWADDDAGRLSSVEWKTDKPPHPADYTLPARLAGIPSAPADLRAAGKIDNFMGLMVGRMPPVPGVLGYQRDQVLDLKAGTTAAAASAPAG